MYYTILGSSNNICEEKSMMSNLDVLVMDPNIDVLVVDDEPHILRPLS